MNVRSFGRSGLSYVQLCGEATEDLSAALRAWTEARPDDELQLIASAMKICRMIALRSDPAKDTLEFLLTLEHTARATAEALNPLEELFLRQAIRN